jgi:GntR family transcriptional regulator
MKSVEANDPRPPSVQIADDLRSQIERGELSPGTRLPSGRVLARQYGVALMTAQAALQRLREERRVYSTGRGYFVGDPMQVSPGVEEPDLVKRLQAVEEEVRELRTRVGDLESRK